MSDAPRVDDYLGHGHRAHAAGGAMLARPQKF